MSMTNQATIEAAAAFWQELYDWIMDHSAHPPGDPVVMTSQFTCESMANDIAEMAAKHFSAPSEPSDELPIIKGRECRPLQMSNGKFAIWSTDAQMQYLVQGCEWYYPTHSAPIPLFFDTTEQVAAFLAQHAGIPLPAPPRAAQPAASEPQQAGERASEDDSSCPKSEPGKYGAIEIRAPDGELDEIVLSQNGVQFHLEQMGDGCWWFSLTDADGHMVHCNLWGTGRDIQAMLSEPESEVVARAEYHGICPPSLAPAAPQTTNPTENRHD